MSIKDDLAVIKAEEVARKSRREEVRRAILELEKSIYNDLLRNPDSFGTSLDYGKKFHVSDDDEEFHTSEFLAQNAIHELLDKDKIARLDTEVCTQTGPGVLLRGVFGLGHNLDTKVKKIFYSLGNDGITYTWTSFGLRKPRELIMTFPLQIYMHKDDKIKLSFGRNVSSTDENSFYLLHTLTTNDMSYDFPHSKSSKYQIKLPKYIVEYAKIAGR